MPRGVRRDVGRGVDRAAVARVVVGDPAGRAGVGTLDDLGGVRDGDFDFSK
jgi:hypothetical protein